MMNKLIFMAIPFLLLTGCADQYSCGQFPESGCQPVSEVYSKTNQGFNDYRSTLFNKTDNTKKLDLPVSNMSTSSSSNVNVVDRLDDRAVLSKPVSMRVLINAYQDKDKDLNAGGYIYLIIKESEWVIDNELR